MALTYNKGEWAEPYVALRILGDGKVYLAAENGRKDPNGWLDVINLVRNESNTREVAYKLIPDTKEVEISVNHQYVITIKSERFYKIAYKLRDEILGSKKRTFSVSPEIETFLGEAEIKKITALTINKSDIFISIRDIGSGIVKNNIGFSIKSAMGECSTLFNTGKNSALIYELVGIDRNTMDVVNSIYDDQGHVSVAERCDLIIHYHPQFIGFPIASRAKCAAFRENLETINPRLIDVFDYLMRDHFFKHNTAVDIPTLCTKLINENPLDIALPEIKYAHMLKEFLFAAYCGLTAGTIWDGKANVNGGIIRVSEDGEVLAHYTLETDAFKEYLFKNCYFDFPDTSKGHGDYGYVYEEDGRYYFKLNFQIRYK